MVKKFMPYLNTIIYKIICKDSNITNTYVGLTIDFKERKRRHEKNCINFKKGKLYDFIRDNGGWDNWEMLVVENYSCLTRKEAGLREKYWYETLNADLNKNYPSRNYDEYYEANKERLSEISRIWREKNLKQF
jgi:hypothetical protein